MLRKSKFCSWLVGDREGIPLDRKVHLLCSSLALIDANLRQTLYATTGSLATLLDSRIRSIEASPRGNGDWRRGR